MEHYLKVNEGVKAGKSKVFVVGYVDDGVCTYTETSTLVEAKHEKDIMALEGHKVFIDVYIR